VKREIKLDGGEITILKSIGLSGSPIYGKLLLDRIGEVQAAEFIDTLAGLIAQDYVLSSRVNVRSMEDVERAFFRVNSSHAHDLRDAIRPGKRREDDRARRRRRT
jgi:hypothetical protein